MEQFNSILRTLAKVAAGVLVTRGYIDESMVEPIIALVLAGAAVFWSWKAHDPESKIV